MLFEELSIPGVFLITENIFTDERGRFQKVFNSSAYKSADLDFNIQELFYSVSSRGVIRGMHFQTDIFAVKKLVHVTNGSIIDVLLDLRNNSNTFGKSISVSLNSNSPYFLYLPEGIAHGFQALEDNSIVQYAQTMMYSPNHDTGIHFNSFGFDWPIKDWIVSKRDLSFSPFSSKEFYF